jgi:ABC-type Fe3+ transport system permease subunit
MGMLGWIMLGLAVWHFTIFLPDRFWGGIVGAFVGALVGAVVSGMAIYAAKSGTFRIPGEHATDVAVVLYALPGAVLGMALIYAEGVRRERRERPLAPAAQTGPAR